MTELREKHMGEIKAVEEKFNSSSGNRYQHVSGTNNPYSTAGQNNKVGQQASTITYANYPQQSKTVSYETYQQQQKNNQGVTRTTAVQPTTSYYSSSNTYQKKE